MSTSRTSAVRSVVTEREKGWAAAWKNPKLIAALPATVVLAQTVQEAKLLGASDAFKNWFVVTIRMYC